MAKFFQGYLKAIYAGTTHFFIVMSEQGRMEAYLEVDLVFKGPVQSSLWVPEGWTETKTGPPSF